MSWDDIEKAKSDPAAAKKLNTEALANAAALAKSYHETFTSEQGQKVLQDLTDKYIMGNDTPLNAENITYEAGYHNGESGIVKYLIRQIGRAKTL